MVEMRFSATPPDEEKTPKKTEKVCGQKPDELVKILTGISSVNRGTNIKARIEQLLTRKYVACEENRQYYANCYGTILSALGIDNKQQPAKNMLYGIEADGEWDMCDTNNKVHRHVNFTRLLELTGYRFENSTLAFQIKYEACPSDSVTGQKKHTKAMAITSEGDIVELCTSLVGTDFSFYNKLRSGDIVLFGDPNEYPRMTHAVLYLGEKRGKHVVFEKNGLQCGKASPFHLNTLEKLIGDSLEKSLHGKRPINQVYVYKSSFNAEDVKELKFLLRHFKKR
jgi:hypothetical protein